MNPEPLAKGDGFGVRLDRLLQAAEEEAAEIRRAAERSSAALLTQAHVEIDRHQREQAGNWNEREAAVAAAEQRAAAELATARQQAAALLADATAQAEAEAQQIRGHAYNRARETTERAEQAAAETTGAAAQELNRLHGLRDRTRAEIVALLRTLDGIRSALAYDLDATGRHEPQPPEPDRPSTTRTRDTALNNSALRRTPSPDREHRSPQT